MIRLSDSPFDPAAEAAALAVDDAGALVQFTGLVRPSDGTTALILHHHPGMTLASIQDLAQSARAVRADGAGRRPPRRPHDAR